ncbi:MAG TPA: ATP-binding protein [Pirellulales bacterium]|jgi:heavy metal sensor kinase|nr:ATP-binding protein [Pirellulales bacterium]
MFRSIRWRLQAWHALILLGVVGCFGTWLYWQVRRAAIRETDARLQAGARFLAATLQRFPVFELEGTGRPAPPTGRGADRAGTGRAGEPLDPEGRPLPPPGFPPPGAPFRPGPDQDGPRIDDFNRPDAPADPQVPSREALFGQLVLPDHAGPAAAAAANDDSTYFTVWLRHGSVLKASKSAPPLAPPDAASLGAPGSDESMQIHLRSRAAFREATTLGPHETRILVGQSIAPQLAHLHSFAWQIAMTGGAVVLLGLAGGWVLSRRVLQPITAMSSTAAAISASNLSRRINLQEVDSELGQLAEVLNAMFVRLEMAFERQAEFVADASHELRTPITILLSHCELALAKPRSADELRETIATCLRASRRMKSLAEGLLTLARADAGKLGLRQDRVSLDRLVLESAATVQPLADHKNVSLAVDAQPVEVMGDSGRLAQVVTNLLTNAIHYNVASGSVAVRVSQNAGAAVVTVADTGCGIPEADWPHIFERFYRVDKARSRETGGYGLGLAICKSIVESHGGTISFRSQTGSGTTFTVRLPAVSLPAVSLPATVEPIAGV